MKLTLSSILVLFSLMVTAQEEPVFSLLRQDDEVEGFQRENPSFYQKLKYQPSFKTGNISFGGSYRGQYEYFNNEEFSFSPNRENGWYLQRFLLHANIQFNENLGFFGELGSSTISGKEDLAPVDQDDLYVNQLFLSYRKENLELRLGRENLKLGSRRLLDPREGPNVRQSFDHVTVEVYKGKRSLRVFAARPVFPEAGIFDNEDFENEEWLWGTYLNKLYAGALNLDAYYLGSHYGASTYALGTEEELRHSLGVRAWKSSGSWQYDNEAIIQFGSFGEQDIFAWTISFNLKNQVHERHQLGVKTELISGTTSENTLGTFNPLYPRGAYFGRVARFGPANLIDIHPYWNYRAGKFTMEIDYDVFWRFSKDDAIYGPPLNIVLEGESDARFIAQQVGTIFNYEFSRHAVMELETNFIFPGDYIEQVRPGAEKLIHGVFTVELRF